MKLKKYLQKKYGYELIDIVSPKIIKVELMLDEAEYMEIKSKHSGLFEFREVISIIEENL
jgi:hypothetical protein